MPAGGLAVAAAPGGDPPLLRWSGSPNGTAVHLSGSGQTLRGLRIRGTVNGAALLVRADGAGSDATLERLQVDRVVVVPDEDEPELTLDLIRTVKGLGARVSVLPHVLEVVGSAVAYDDVYGMPVLGVRRFGLTRSSQILKRIMDLVVGGLLFLVFSPVMAVAALLIKLDSPGPVLFRQDRMGREGRRFRMLKFRSMVDGADALRVYELFVAPFEQSVAWSDRGVQGTSRFLGRYWTLVAEVAEAQGSGVAADEAELERGRQVLRTLNKTIRKVTRDIEGFRFNTAVSALMELQNEALEVWSSARGSLTLAQWREVLRDMTLLRSPMAPHVAAEAWEVLGQDGDVLGASWPAWDEELAADEVVTVVVQVNGKLRDRLQVAVDAEKDDVLAQARQAENAARFLDGKQVVKEVYVPGKLVNFVVR